jgi:hypothetical protein
MAVAAICAVVCYFMVPETHHVDIESDASVATIEAAAQAKRDAKAMGGD